MTAAPLPAHAADAVSLRSGRALDVVCFEAVSPEQVAMHYEIRRAVFVDEQQIFTDSDVDENDARDDVVRVLATRGSDPVGAVRLYPLDLATGLWKGDRLAVLPRCRSYGAGAPLVRFAVAHAGAQGGSRMIASIQMANVKFFERLGWRACGDSADYFGRTHQPMGIALMPVAT